MSRESVNVCKCRHVYLCWNVSQLELKCNIFSQILTLHIRSDFHLICCNCFPYMLTLSVAIFSYATHIQGKIEYLVILLFLVPCKCCTFLSFEYHYLIFNAFF